MSRICTMEAHPIRAANHPMQLSSRVQLNSLLGRKFGRDGLLFAASFSFGWPSRTAVGLLIVNRVCLTRKPALSVTKKRKQSSTYSFPVFSLGRCGS
jgi:hypothetical protein